MLGHLGQQSLQYEESQLFLWNNQYSHLVVSMNYQSECPPYSIKMLILLARLHIHCTNLSPLNDFTFNLVLQNHLAVGSSSVAMMKLSSWIKPTSSWILNEQMNCSGHRVMHGTYLFIFCINKIEKSNI